MIVVVDADVILDEDSELSVEVEVTGFVIAEELLLDGKPDLLSGVVTMLSIRRKRGRANAVALKVTWLSKAL
jgi:hypothetical protein